MSKSNGKHPTVIGTWWALESKAGFLCNKKHVILEDNTGGWGLVLFRTRKEAREWLNLFTEYKAEFTPVHIIMSRP